MSDLTLYHYWRSSCSWRVRWALNFKNIPFKSVHIDLLKKEQESPQFHALNPLGMVPMLKTPQVDLVESLAILEWLEERYPSPSLMPKKDNERAIVRALSLCIVAGTQPMQNLAAQNYYSTDPKKKIEYAQYWISKGLKNYENLLQKYNCHGNYSFGISLTLADLCLIPQCYNAKRFELNLADFPLINKIEKNCLDHPSCKSAYPDESMITQ